jgi:hypothetical protein
MYEVFMCIKRLIAGFAGADYVFTNGEAFVIWILMAILVNNCLKR